MENNIVDTERIEELKKQLHEKCLEKEKKLKRRTKKKVYRAKAKSYKAYNKNKVVIPINRKKDRLTGNISTLNEAIVDRIPVRMSMKKAC